MQMLLNTTSGQFSDADEEILETLTGISLSISFKLLPKFTILDQTIKIMSMYLVLIIMQS